MYIGPKVEQAGYYTTEPTGAVLHLLNSMNVMYIIPFVSVSMFFAIGYAIVKLHHLPKYHWSKRYKSDIGLINILSILGWFYHSLWVVAVIIAFINWQQVENMIVRLIQKALGIYNPTENDDNDDDLDQNMIDSDDLDDNDTNINVDDAKAVSMDEYHHKEVTFVKNKNNE